MSEKNNSKYFALAFLTLLTSFPLFVGFYFADPGKNLFSQRGMERSPGTDFKKVKKESRVFQGKIVLLKDSRLTVNKTRLVYKGLHDTRILLEYYLLELDPDTPYRNEISQTDARIGIRLGDSVFQLVSVSRTVLKLQIDALYKTYSPLE